MKLCRTELELPSWFSIERFVFATCVIINIVVRRENKWEEKGGGKVERRFVESLSQIKYLYILLMLLRPSVYLSVPETCLLFQRFLL